MTHVKIAWKQWNRSSPGPQMWESVSDARQTMVPWHGGSRYTRGRFGKFGIQWSENFLVTLLMAVHRVEQVYLWMRILLCFGFSASRAKLGGRSNQFWYSKEKSSYLITDVAWSFDNPNTRKEAGKNWSLSSSSTAEKLVLLVYWIWLKAWCTQWRWLVHVLVVLLCRPGKLSRYTRACRRWIIMTCYVCSFRSWVSWSSLFPITVKHHQIFVSSGSSSNSSPSFIIGDLVLYGVLVRGEGTKPLCAET